MTADFDSLDPQRYTFVAIAVSSIAFGLMHGDRWLAGTAAGVLYAIAFLWRGRIGDAVVAHATTNALLAYVWRAATGAFGKALIRSPRVTVVV